MLDFCVSDLKNYWPLPIFFLFTAVVLSLISQSMNLIMFQHFLAIMQIGVLHRILYWSRLRFGENARRISERSIKVYRIVISV